MLPKWQRSIRKISRQKEKVLNNVFALMEKIFFIVVIEGCDDFNKIRETS